MPGAPENPVLGGVEYKHPLLPPTSTRGQPGPPGDIHVTFAGTSSLSATVLHPTGSHTYSTAGTYQWTCPPGVYSIKVECFGGGGGGGGGSNFASTGGGGGGGGAYASILTVPVTPGNTYTVVVGAGGAGAAQQNPPLQGASGTSSTFTGDSGVQVIAVGGTGGKQGQNEPGGAASSCTGDIRFSGGQGGRDASGCGGGGGASGNQGGNGNAGGDAIPVPATPGTGGAGANGGGSGGAGGPVGVGGSGHNGTSPGGAGGGGGDDSASNGGNGSDGAVIITVPNAASRQPQPQFTLRGVPHLLPLSLQLKLNTISSYGAPTAGGVTRNITLTLAGTSSLTAAVFAPVLVTADHERPIFNGIAPAHLLPLPLTLKLNRQPTAGRAAPPNDIHLFINGTSSLTVTIKEPVHNIHVTLAGSSSLTVGPYDSGPKGVHLSQLALEVARTTNPEVRLSQITVEVARPRTGLHIWKTM